MRPGWFLGHIHERVLLLVFTSTTLICEETELGVRRMMKTQIGGNTDMQIAFHTDKLLMDFLSSTDWEKNTRVR